MEFGIMEADERTEATKKCPYCAERILADAIKCRFCGEFLVKPPKLPMSSKSPTKWYFATHTLIIALLCVGPLALPLVFLNPRYKIITKLVITVVVIALTIALCYLMVKAYTQLMEQIDQLAIN